MLAAIAIVMSACGTHREISQADMIRHDAAVDLLQSQQFTLKADRLILDKRSFPSVSPTTNFIRVDGDQAVVQVSPGNSGGPNGVGGFTVKGTVSGYETKVKDNGSVTVRFNVSAIAGSCSVTINLPQGGYIANATIHNTMRGKNANIYGSVSPVDQNVFVGRGL